MAAINANVDLRSKTSSGALYLSCLANFGFKLDETDSDPPTCKLCMKVRAAGGNTSNQRRHLQNHHPVESSKIAKAKPEKRHAHTAGAGQSTSKKQQLSITVFQAPKVRKGR